MLIPFYSLFPFNYALVHIVPKEKYKIKFVFLIKLDSGSVDSVSLQILCACRVNCPPLGGPTHLNSVHGVGGPTVAQWFMTSALAMNETAQVSVNPYP